MRLALQVVTTVFALGAVAANASPYLPSQGQLTVQRDCAGTTLKAGQKITVRASANGVTIATNGQTVAIAADDSSDTGTASAVGYFCGMQSANDMCAMGLPSGTPVQINDQLIFNGFTTSGAMSVGDPLPAGFLVDSSRSLYDLQLFDNGNGIELSGVSFPSDETPDPSSNTSQEVVIPNCLLAK